MKSWDHWSGQRADQGFTIVELLVVLLIFGVIGSVATAGVLSAFRSAVETQTRIEARQELEIAAQQVTRTLRGASVGSESFLLETSNVDEEIGVSSQFGGEDRITWFSVDNREIEGSDPIEFQRVLIQCNGADCLDNPASSRQLVTDIDNPPSEPLFTYRRLGDSESDGGSFLPGESDVIQVRLVRALEDRNPVIVETSVSIRNVRYGRG